MYKTVLVGGLIEEGKRLIEKLERNHFPVKAALWRYRPESMSWKFVIASPVLDKVGPMAAYTRVQRLLGSLQPTSLTLTDVSLISPKSREFEDFRLLGADPGQMASADTQDPILGEVYVYSL